MMQSRALELDRSCCQLSTVGSSTLAKSRDLEDLGSNPTSTVSSLGDHRLVTLTSADFGVRISKMGIIELISASL